VRRRPRGAAPARAPGVRRPGGAGWGNRGAPAPAGGLLPRAGPAAAPAGGVSVLAHLYQGDGRAPARARRAVLGRRRPGPAIAGLALPGDRDRPHGSGEPAGGAGAHPAGAGLRTWVSCPVRPASAPAGPFRTASLARRRPV